ncbi:major facilitator superfamily domain-containing protein [Naematelia encephala]|uniref:Major facilitator superfamily domain-containing protein n=1 Tax=Naematelia encephala TaxID=71784 RepID=A0A1Y2B5Q5_9TREE|nr:major facilitator superfamily domain-containing protein [Naematelia encephala]
MHFSERKRSGSGGSNQFELEYTAQVFFYTSFSLSGLPRKFNLVDSLVFASNVSAVFAFEVFYGLQTCVLVRSEVDIPLYALLPKAQVPWFGQIPRVFFSSMLIAIAFGFTQTSLIYAFRVMTCDEYFKTHEWVGDGDRCAIPRIESDTAIEIAIVGSSTTFFTMINVFIVGWMVKRYGVKTAMFQQTAWAAARNLTQIYAQTIGGRTGIIIIQVTQFFNILGSGGGSQLAGNSYIAALADPEKRTGLFGVLSGVNMFGNALGYVGGGLAFRYIGPLYPFYGAFCLLVLATIFGALFLPYIAPPVVTEKTKNGIFDPLKIFIPRKRMINGRSRWDLNLCLLGSGVFLSVFATGYVPLGLQLVGTNVFGFEPDDSGFMISFTLLINAFFLSICFPRIITSGRRLMSHRRDVPSNRADERPDDPYQAEEPTVLGSLQQNQAQQPTDVQHGSTFDLYFLQSSIFTDALLTSGVSFSTRGLHLFIAAGILPFASGTGAAAKGVTLDFVTPELRADALGAISLVEKIAYVLTTGVFGYVFSILSELQRPMLLFVANAAVALIAFLLLIPVRMPRPGQELVSG